MTTTTPTICPQRDLSLAVPDADQRDRAAGQLARAVPETPDEWERLARPTSPGQCVQLTLLALVALTALLSMWQVLSLPWSESLPEIGYSVRHNVTGELP